MSQCKKEEFRERAAVFDNLFELADQVFVLVVLHCQLEARNIHNKQSKYEKVEPLLSYWVHQIH